MGRVQGTVRAAAWLAAVQEMTKTEVGRSEDGMLLIRIDAGKGTVTLLQQEEDQAAAVSLPIFVTQGESVQCRVPARKLEGMSQLLGGKSEELVLTSRMTTFSCRRGKKQALLPSYRVREVNDLLAPEPAKGGVRFLIEDVKGLSAALQESGDVVEVRTGQGTVHVHGASFKADARSDQRQLWPKETLLGCLARVGGPVQCQLQGLSRVVLTAAEEGRVWQFCFKPLPVATLYMSKRSEVKSGQVLWSNKALLPVQKQEQKLVPPVEPSGTADGTAALDEERVKEERVKEEEAPQIESIAEEEVDLFEPDDVLRELDSLPGLARVKKQIREIALFAAFEKERREALGVFGQLPTLHMSFLGNPGTGKTMVARMLGRIFFEMGLLERGHVVEVDRQTLVGAYMGHTEQNLAKAVKRAKGGILFVDEAYALYRKDSGKDFGHSVINGLVKAMEDQRGRLIVILAGYKREMNEFFASNPGFRERVPFHLEFSDYSGAELTAIADFMAGSDHYRLTEEAKDLLLAQIEREKIDETFGNARTVRNLLEKAKIRHAVRASEAAERREDAYTVLSRDDFQEEERTESLADVLAELDALVGLEDVKKWVRQAADVLAMEQKRAVHGLAEQRLTFHMAFTGNPGTGKTTVARLIGRLLRAMGLLQRGHYVEVSRKDLVAGYSGQTALKTAERIKEALGGVLFVDEAYALAKGGGDSFGAEALATLIKEMEDRKGALTVIFAGYPKEMEELFRLNPGLRSRVRFHLAFPDYTPSDLVEIVKRKAEMSQYMLTPEAEEKIWEVLLHASLDAASDFGNGRLAERLFEGAKIRLSERVARLGLMEREGLMTITEEDVGT